MRQLILLASLPFDSFRFSNWRLYEIHTHKACTLYTFDFLENQFGRFQRMIIYMLHVLLIQFRLAKRFLITIRSDFDLLS